MGFKLLLHSGVEEGVFFVSRKVKNTIPPSFVTRIKIFSEAGRTHPTGAGANKPGLFV